MAKVAKPDPTWCSQPSGLKKFLTTLAITLIAMGLANSGALIYWCGKTEIRMDYVERDIGAVQARVSEFHP